MSSKIIENGLKYWSKGEDMYGQRIKEIRMVHMMTQAQFAETICVTQSTLGKYEREELQPNVETIIKICKTFGVSSDYLLGLED